MDKSKIEILINTAIKNLFKNQPDIYIFTSETNQTEWNLAHHLATELIKLFPSYSCDLDVTKRSFKFHRPDIIIHKRGKQTHNLLVVEMKKDGTQKKLKIDAQKIKDEWFCQPLAYQFGAVISLNKKKIHKLIIMENSKK